MYLGTTTVKEKRWGPPRWHSVFGYVPVVVAVVDVVKHVYQCDTCGHVWHVPAVATEPFYCTETDECCQQLTLVSVDPEHVEV